MKTFTIISWARRIVWFPDIKDKKELKTLVNRALGYYLHTREGIKR